MRTQIASLFFFGLILGFMWLVPAACADEVYTITSGVAENETGMYLPGFITETAPTTVMSSEGNQTEASVAPVSKSAGLQRSGPSSPRPGIEWQNAYGASYTEEFASIRQTPDGGYIACGLTDAYYPNGDVMSFIGGGDAWIMKLSPNGTPAWQSAYGGQGRDECRSIRPVSDGYIFVGFSNSVNGEFADKNHGGYDIYVVKLRLDGSVEWQQQVGGENDDVGTSIRQTADGGFIITGYEDFSHSGKICQFTEMTNAWVIKLNPDGTVQWQKKLEGNKGDQGTGIIQARDGNYVMYGFSNSEIGPGIGGNHGNYDLWVVKMDSYGAILWNSMYGGSGFEATNNVNDDGIQQTNDDGFVIIGQTSSYNNGDVGTNHGMSDVWVVKLSQYGNLQWQKTLGGKEYDMASGSIHQTADGGYALAGMTRSSNSGDVGENHGDWDFWVARLDKSYEDGNGGHLPGELLWQEVLGGNGYEMADSLQPTSDGGYIVSGWTDSNSDGDVGINHGESDAWVVKLRPRFRFDIIDFDTGGFIPNANIELYDYAHSESQNMTSYGGVIMTPWDGPVIFTDSGISHQYSFAKGQTYKVSISAEGYPPYTQDLIFQHDGQREQIKMTAFERPLGLTYSITGAPNPGWSMEELTPQIESEIRYINTNLGERLNWTPVFIHNGDLAIKDDFGVNGGGLNDATFHFHFGHGGHDINPFNSGKTALVLHNGQSLFADEVKQNWGGKNKWVYLSSCEILDDESWEDALDSSHGIFGFKTKVTDYAFGSFLENAMNRDTLAHSFQRATEDRLTNDTISVVIFSDSYQFENDHLPGFGQVAPDEVISDGNYVIRYYTGMQES
ncbi:MAG: hypothetical protein WC379_14740 [Methanoregula sp.]|jgi:hypothetical protein